MFKIFVWKKLPLLYHFHRVFHIAYMRQTNKLIFKKMVENIDNFLIFWIDRIHIFCGNSYGWGKIYGLSKFKKLNLLI